LGLARNIRPSRKALPVANAIDRLASVSDEEKKVLLQVSINKPFFFDNDGRAN
jgi:hypothetical protein